jgi:GDP-L-fucose synthase
MEKSSRIYIAGHRGLVGRALYQKLRNKGYTNIITYSHKDLDLLNQSAVNSFFIQEKPEYVFLAAAKVGGIGANSTYPATFIYENIMIGFNLVHASYQSRVKKLLNFGSSCIYPRLAPQPIKEEYLLTGELEPTNDAYALAKISMIKLCTAYNKQYGTNYLTVMPTNLYGLGDTYDIENSHVLPALIRKFYEAKISGTNHVVLWGDGSPLREFLYSDDLAEAAVFLMENKDAKDIRNSAGDFINVGSGQEFTIKELAEIICSVVYLEDLPSFSNKQLPEPICRIIWDTSKPNGTPRKLCDISRLSALGFKAKTELREGIKNVYADFLSHLKIPYN